LHRLHATRPGKFPAGQELRVNGGASHLSAFPPAQAPLTKMPEKFITVPRFERLLFFGLDGLPEAEWEALEIGKNLKRDPATSFVYEVMAEMGLSMTAMNYADAYGWGLQDGKPTVKRLRVNYPRAWWRFVSRIGKELNVDPYLILAVARQESTFRPALTSSAGACGVMQVMPGTAKAIAKNTGLRADRLDNPHQSLQLGARYIADMLRISHGNIVYALASYNAGPGNCRKWQKQFAGKDMESFIEAIPFAETRDYVKRVLGNYAAYYSLYPATN
jgi:soluble lytic murein transglycosylase-like protein